MTYGTTVVVMSRRQLVLIASAEAGALRYHSTRWKVDVIITRCGHPVWCDDPAVREQWVSLRRDTADLIADPCLVCFP
jgi:hypothetical protein